MAEMGHVEAGLRVGRSWAWVIRSWGRRRERARRRRPSTLPCRPSLPHCAARPRLAGACGLYTRPLSWMLPRAFAARVPADPGRLAERGDGSMAEPHLKTQTRRAQTELREQILSGELPAGTRLYEMAIAERPRRVADAGARGDVAPGRGGAAGAAPLGRVSSCAASAWPTCATRSSCAACSRGSPRGSPPSGGRTIEDDGAELRAASTGWTTCFGARVEDRRLRHLRRGEREVSRAARLALGQHDHRARAGAGDVAALRLALGLHPRAGRRSRLPPLAVRGAGAAPRDRRGDRRAARACAPRWWRASMPRGAAQPRGCGHHASAMPGSRDRAEPGPGVDLNSACKSPILRE